uniref:BTB domain-containing protein n=1 Tax=Caenorhabditis japonica TaxID=281687 RepID=A0A8R1EM08_CAEJA
MSGKNNKGVVSLRIINFSELEKTEWSDPVYIGNVQWVLGACTETSEKTKNVKHLGVRLLCQHYSLSNLWSCTASVRFALVKPNSNNKNNAFSMEFEQKFDLDDKKLEVPNFINWEEANNMRFIKDDQIIVKAHITITNITGIQEKILETFEYPVDNLTDAVLIVEGKKVHVGKQILAWHSRFFRALFYSEFAESSQDEITLEDIRHSEFVDFLNFVYPTSKTINKENVEHLLKLADRFEAPSVLSKCEQFLIFSNEHVVVKLKYSEKYRLSRIQDNSLKALTTCAQIIELPKHPDYKSLGGCTHTVLLHKMIDLVSLQSVSPK